MKLATQDKPFFGETMEQKFATVLGLGFEAFEIDGKVLVERFDEVKLAMSATGCKVPTVCGGYRGWIGHFVDEKRKQAIQDIGEILRYLSELGGEGIVVPAAWGMFSKRLPQTVLPRSEEEDRTVLIDSIAQINIIAIETGTTLYLEPLNRYEDHMLNYVGQAAELIEAGNFSNVKVIADFFHMNIEEPDINDSLRHISKHLGHVHLADSHRYQPGHGHLDFVSPFRTLRELGYDGYMSFECRVWGEDQIAAYGDAVNYIKHCINLASKSL